MVERQLARTGRGESVWRVMVDRLGTVMQLGRVKLCTAKHDHRSYLD